MSAQFSDTTGDGTVTWLAEAPQVRNAIMEDRFLRFLQTIQIQCLFVEKGAWIADARRHFQHPPASRSLVDPVSNPL